MSTFPSGYSDPSSSAYYGNQQSFGQISTIQTQQKLQVSEMEMAQNLAQQNPQVIQNLTAMQNQMMKQNKMLDSNYNPMLASLMNPNSPALSESSVQMKCPSCQRDITTNTSYVVGHQTLICCAALLPPLLCWIPFLCNSCKDVNHTCPNCKSFCGKFNRHLNKTARNVQLI